jgi:hypothetical protein
MLRYYDGNCQLVKPVADPRYLFVGRCRGRRDIRDVHSGAAMEKRNPPASFSIIQEGNGVPLQRFWVPVHIAITLTLLLAIILNWSQPARRNLILIGIGCYVVMRVWSGFYFIPEMLSFQKIPLDSAPTTELTSKVSKWARLSWFREPLDLGLFFCLVWSIGINTN